ncbi:hypothetical protein I3842_Q133200 [Carya illinoinensis]|uniref:Uncharacterized protein n=1 Tax=Carya illinoinensis TaxID=32201 RepID=A0A921ZYB6_CARIL|nr:hypothetical protein I3842_Q133200 [Carya illinoinensis]
MISKIIALEVENLVSAPNVVALITWWTIVGIYMVDHLAPANQAICHDATSQSMSPNLAPNMISILKNEYDQLLGRIRASSSIATLAHSSIASACLVSSTQDPWVIDSVANEHLTGSQYEEQDWYEA